MMMTIIIISTINRRHKVILSDILVWLSSLLFVTDIWSSFLQHRYCHQNATKMQFLATVVLLLLSAVNAFHKLSSRISRAVVGKPPHDEIEDMKSDRTSTSMATTTIGLKHARGCRNSKRLKLVPIGMEQDVDAITAACIGGTVGVMSVAVLVEMRKKSDDGTLESCPYCMGNGEILCASCFGMCTSSAVGKDGVACSCDVCGGRGLIMCINCKGDGRETPILFKSKAVRDPEYAADGISIDSPSII